MDKDDELVKYMSNLPCYLERGVNLQERAFNIGVLDWGNLEKWQHQRNINRQRAVSVSCSEFSSSFLADGLPSNSTDHCHSAVHEKMHVLQSCMAASKGLRSVKSLHWNRQDKIQGIDQGLEDHGESRLAVSRKNCLDKCTFQMHEVLHSMKGAGLAYSPRDEIKLQGNYNNKGTQKVQESNDSFLEKELTGRPDMITCLPRDVHNDLSEECACSNNSCSMGSKETSQRSFLEKSRDSRVSSDISKSHSLPSKLDRHKKLQVKQCSSFHSAPSTCSSGKPKAVATLASLFPETSTSKDKIRCQSSTNIKLFEPILRPESKSLSRNVEFEPLSGSSVSEDRASRVSKSPRIWSPRLKCCRSINVSHSQLGKSGNSVARALLRVACKNGHPLLSFALNTERDILAATIKKKSTTRKSSSKWSYTVFKVPAVKGEKASKMKEGGQAEALSCYPILVSHLNVSEFSYSRSTRQREFVLLPMGPRNNELAAIVVQIPSRAILKTPLNGCQCQPLKVGSKGHSRDISSCSEDGEKARDQQLSVNENCISTTVILPSGVHSLPSKGVPSSLIERWKTGGSCDCGGWDMGCKLRILVNRNHFCSEFYSSKACTSSSANKLAVFTQVNEQEQEQHPLLSLFPSKDGIYSVEFDSSISELQAFSICIAVLDCRSPSQCLRQGKNIDAETQKE